MEKSRSGATYLLRSLFAAGLWLALFFTVPGLNFAMPGHILTLALLLYAVGALAALWVICRIWPGFLNLPNTTPPSAVLGRFLLLWPLCALILTIPFGLIGYLETRFLWVRPEANPQVDFYILLAAVWNALWWAFLPAVLLARRQAKQWRQP